MTPPNNERELLAQATDGFVTIEWYAAKVDDENAVQSNNNVEPSNRWTFDKATFDEMADKGFPDVFKFPYALYVPSGEAMGL